MVLQRLGRRPGRIISPQRVHQGGSTDRLPAVHGERGQQAAFLDATQRDRLLARQLDWAEDPDPAATWPSLHEDSIPRARPLGQSIAGENGNSAD